MSMPASMLLVCRSWTMKADMSVRTASCRCGALQATCTGAPVRISVCHCLDCQKRSGSAFAAQARWPEGQVAVTGAYTTYETLADSGRWGRYNFCPTCGDTVFYTNELFPGRIAVPLGAFADPSFPAPKHSVFEDRKHGWVELTGDDWSRLA